MPIYSDQFFVMDPGAPPPSGTALTVQNYSYNDQNGDGLISTTAGDTFNGLTVTSVWVGDRIQVRWPDGTTQWITGVTFYVSGGPAVFTPTDGTILQNATFLSSTWVNTSTQIAVGSLFPTCFTLGTMILTADGEVPIEELRPGDLIVTLDNGLQPLRWVSRTTARAVGPFAPVRMAAGALGNRREMRVSQQHRMLLTGWRAELLFGEDEVLVAAKHLVNDHGIRVVPGGEITYLHLLFDSHEVVFAEGVPTESFFAVSDTAPDPQRDEAVALFPELAAGPISHSHTARAVLKGHEAALLAA